jgi:hypothetical protein
VLSTGAVFSAESGGIGKVAELANAARDKLHRRKIRMVDSERSNFTPWSSGYGYSHAKGMILFRESMRDSMLKEHFSKLLEYSVQNITYCHSWCHPGFNHDILAAPSCANAAGSKSRAAQSG